MPWYQQLITGTSIAGVVLGLSLAIAAGLAVGAVKMKGLSLGIAGVLFAGLALSDLVWSHGLLLRFAGAGHGHGLTESIAAINTLEERRRETLAFLREFGLVLFVYSIGMQVGPGFLSSLRAQGLRWNLVMMMLVAMNLLVVDAVHRWLKVDAVVMVGLLSGAVTNTPGLAAAEQALRDVPDLSAAQRGLAEVGCAVAYPAGIVGTILSLMLARLLFRRDRGEGAAQLEGAIRKPRPLGNIDLRVANPAMAGRRVGDLEGLLKAPVVVSRMMRGKTIELPSADTLLAIGDLLHAVGEERDLARLAVLLGERSPVDLREISRRLGVRRLIVTRSEVVGKTVGTLQLRTGYGVNITRVLRAGLELVPNATVDLHYGDTLMVVGEEERLAEVEKLVGNSVGELEHPQLVPVFLGIAAGVLLGSIPLPIGGLPAPVRLGLAGGPLLVALILSHLGRLGRFNFYLPNSAVLMLRDVGIVLFLGCVGLMSGERFVETIARGPGFQWMLVGAAITLIPLLVTELFARLVLKMDYTALCGVVAGGMTSPPALAFSNQFVGDGAAVAYGAVYPLTMILRVVSAQLLVVFWVGGASP